MTLLSARYRMVLFDCGETLVTLDPARETLFSQAAQSIGVDVQKEAVVRAYEIVDCNYKYSSVSINSEAERIEYYRQYNYKICEVLGILSSYEKLQPRLAASFRANKNWKLIQGVQDVLASLYEAGIMIGVVANWDSNLQSLLDGLGIGRYMSAIISSAEAAVEKPDPKIFEYAIDRMPVRVDKKNIVYVGNDYALDIVSARDAGITPVLIDRPGVYPSADCMRFTSMREWYDKSQMNG